MCLHGVLSSIPFNFVCSMATLKNVLTFCPNPKAECVCKDILSICLHGALRFIPVSLIGNMTTFRKKVLTLGPIPGIEGVCKERKCACMANYAPFPLI